MHLLLGDNARAATHGARTPDSLALAAADVALGLDLLEDAGGEHVLLDAQAGAAAGGAGVDDAVGAAAALARAAHRLLLDRELDRPPVVEVAQRQRRVRVLVRPPPHTPVPEVPAAPEEPREQVERVVVLWMAAASLVLLQPFVAVLVVYPPGLFAA